MAKRTKKYPKNPGESGELKHDDPEKTEPAISRKQWQEAENASPDDFEDGIGEPGKSFDPGERREDKDEG